LGLDKQKVWSVIRRAVTLDVTPYFYFDSDAIVVRTTCRVGFGFVHPQAIVQITASGSWTFRLGFKRSGSAGTRKRHPAIGFWLPEVRRSIIWLPGNPAKGVINGDLGNVIRRPRVHDEGCGRGAADGNAHGRCERSGGRDARFRRHVEYVGTVRCAPGAASRASIYRGTRAATASGRRGVHRLDARGGYL
jgi:hypothetical protein